MEKFNLPESHLVVYDKEYILRLVNKRKNEIKLGEKVQAIEGYDQSNLEVKLKDSDTKYVLLGLPEDIGIRANKGRAGAYSAWNPTLRSFLNIQSNRFLRGDNILVLGHINFDDLMAKAQEINFRKSEGLKMAREIVSEIDGRVFSIIQAIVKSGKEPVIIGGGHNNAYPNLKGASSGLHLSGKISNASINAINLDAHSDFRKMEGRHSGNGFRYAFEEAYLNKYSIVGLHENYNPENVFEELNFYAFRIHYSLYEDIFVREISSFQDVVKRAVEFVHDDFVGLEIDLDSVQNIPASAKTSSGISANQARFYVNYVAENCKVAYFHIPEGAPVLSHIKTDNKTGKLISYLISDYIKARERFGNLVI